MFRIGVASCLKTDTKVIQFNAGFVELVTASIEREFRLEAQAVDDLGNQGIGGAKVAELS
jgi:hypothetical protein